MIHLHILVLITVVYDRLIYGTFKLKTQKLKRSTLTNNSLYFRKWNFLAQILKKKLLIFSQEKAFLRYSQKNSFFVFPKTEPFTFYPKPKK